MQMQAETIKSVKKPKSKKEDHQQDRIVKNVKALTINQEEKNTNNINAETS